MSLTEKISEEIKNAMKAKDKVALRGLRAIKSAILLEQTSGRGKDLSEDQEVKMLQKLVKQRKDSLEIYEKQNREDLAQKEREEIEVIERFLPTQLSVEELTAVLKKIIADTGASSMKDMGKVMGLASKQLGGKADGKTIAGVVKSLLS